MLAGGLGVGLVFIPAGSAMAATAALNPAATIPICGGITNDITTITTTEGLTTTSTTDATLPDLTATATRVEGIVIDGSTSTVVYDQTVSPGGSAPNAALFSAAAAADRADAPGSTIGQPTQVSSSTVESTPVLVSSTDGTPTLTTVSNVTIGPATIVFGDNGDSSCLLPEGAEDINTVVTDTTPVTDTFQSTATTTTTYAVDANVTAPSAAPVAVAASPTAPGTLAFTGVNEGPIVLFGLALLLSGLGLTVLSERRRRLMTRQSAQEGNL